jgi:hypothetical protein
MIIVSAFLPAYLPTAGRQGGVSSRLARDGPGTKIPWLVDLTKNALFLPFQFLDGVWHAFVFLVLAYHSRITFWSIGGTTSYRRLLFQ